MTTPDISNLDLGWPDPQVREHDTAATIDAKRVTLWGRDTSGGVDRRVSVDSSGNVNTNATFSASSIAINDGTATSQKLAVDASGNASVRVTNTPTVTANAGTNLNTSALALESGGNLASIKTNTDRIVAQPSTLVSFVTAVTTAGTRVQLATNSVQAGVLQAPSTNTGVIYVGGSTVSSTVFGAELQPGQATGIAIDNTNKLYIDSSVNGDKCAFLGSN